MSLRDQMQERRDAAQAELDALLTTAETEVRDLTDEESAAFTEKVAGLEKIDTRIAELHESETRHAAAKVKAAQFLPAEPGTPSGVKVGDEPKTYRKGDPRPEASFVRDFVRAGKGDVEARERLNRNEREVNHFWEQRAGVTTVNGAGGEFAPPLWQVADFVNLPRAGRAFANCLQLKELPGGVSSINLPTIATGVTVAAQAAQNTAVSNTDPTTSSVAIAIKTVAGYNLISQQELDQSPINMDDVFLGDLAAAYNAVLDAAVITAVAGTANIVAMTYTDGAPTTLKVGYQIGDAIQRIHTQRFAPPSVIVMTPKRWANFLTYGDSQNRPLVVPTAGSASVNAWGTQADLASQGVVGTYQGVPVVVDPTIPNNLGGGSNQDEIFVMKADDILLYESMPRLDSQAGPYANQLAVLLRFWRYYGVGVRTPKSVALITGSGLINPAFGA